MQKFTTQHYEVHAEFAEHQGLNALCPGGLLSVKVTFKSNYIKHKEKLLIINGDNC